MTNTKHYAYRVLWSADDEEYVALCAEFPSLSFLAETQGEALEGINQTIEEVVLDMENNNEEVPEPINEMKFKGKFMTRTTPEIHRNLFLKAKELGISMNRLVNQKLAS